MSNNSNTNFSQGENFGNQNYRPQPAQPPRRPSYICGRVVRSENDIMPSEVPMDGKTCVFPLVDGSAIICKTWTPDFQLAEQVYIPLQQAQPSPILEEVKTAPGYYDEDTVNLILQRLDKIEKLVKRNVYSNKPKKDGAGNGHE